MQPRQSRRVSPFQAEDRQFSGSRRVWGSRLAGWMRIMGAPLCTTNSVYHSTVIVEGAMRNFSGEPEATGATHPFRSHTSTSPPLVPARFQASHVIAHPFLALTGCGLGPDHNASVHQAHGPGTAGRVGIRPHLPTVVPELHGLQ